MGYDSKALAGTLCGTKPDQVFDVAVFVSVTFIQAGSIRPFLLDALKPSRNLGHPVRYGITQHSIDAHLPEVLPSHAIPRVEHRYTRRFKVSHVPGDYSHTMDQCSCGNQAIPEGAGVGHMQLGAAQSHGRVHRQNATFKCR